MSHSHTVSTHDVKLEVCVDSISSAIAAAEGGASRIELCSALSEGGLTPTIGVLKVLKDLALNVEIFCMLRPRRGNDFLYTEKEMDALCCDMEILREYGADGFVFGALTSERNVDMENCRKIIQQSAGLPMTFHRAFDLTNPTAMHETVVKLKELGFKRILSSGFRQTALEGIEFLAQLIARHHGDIKIMPGAGISVDNLEEILTVTKCTEFHASARAAADSVGNYTSSTRMDWENISMGKQDVEPYLATDAKVVRKMVNIARAMSVTT